MSKILFSRPWYDEGTSYLYSWTEELIAKAEQLNHDVIDLDKGHSNMATFTSHLKKSKPALIHLNGHGSETVVAGQDHKPILDNTNKEFTKDTIIYARACDSAAVLGEECVKSGAKCYIGYVKPFIVRIDLTKLHKPLEDEVAPYTIEPSNRVTMTLIKGHTAGEAIKRSQELSRKKLAKLMSSEAPEGAGEILMAVFSNMRNQVLCGETSSKI
jgi:hypothetical protein